MIGRLIYTSISLCNAEDIKDIREHSRAANSHRNITGALLLSHGRFMQYLEGDAAAIDELYEKIGADRRHHECKVLDRRSISNRIFQGWAMTWLPSTRDTDLLIDALVPPNRRVDALDGSSAGAFFYALSKLSQRL